jgi:hypothetical protein
MEELEALYADYMAQGYSINQAYRKMRVAGFDTNEHREYMKGLYDSGGSKKKSQDTSLSEPISEEVSMASTSNQVSQEKQPGGDSDSVQLGDFDSFLEDYFPTNFNIKDFEVEGGTSIPEFLLPNQGGSVKLNPQSVLNGNDDTEFDRLVTGLQFQTFQDWARSTSRPVQGYIDSVLKKSKGELDPDETLIMNQLGRVAAFPYYNQVLDQLALAYTIDAETRGIMERDNITLEEALENNDEFIENALKGMAKRGKGTYEGRRDRRIRREVERVQNMIDQKRDELEADYINNFFGKAFIDSLPSQFNEKDEDGNLTSASKTKLSYLEKTLKRRTGLSLDLSGDNRVGNNPFIRVRPMPMGHLSFDGDLVTRSNMAFENMWNSMAYVGSKIFPEILTGNFKDNYYNPATGEFVNIGESMVMDVEMNLRKSESEMAELSEKMNEYRLGISASVANADWSNVIEQSFLMTADGVPFMIPMIAAPWLGVGGTAAFSAALGVGQEAVAIRNDPSFDSFKKDGREYSYGEAAEEVGSYNLEDIKAAGYEVETDYWSRTGYLSAVGIGDFGVAYAGGRALMGAYQKGQIKELQNWFRGYMHGMGYAVSEGAFAQAFSVFERSVARGISTDTQVDFEQTAADAVDAIIGGSPLSVLMHTSGSAYRGISGVRNAPEVIPFNAEEISSLKKGVREYQIKISRSNDPTAIREANQFIYNSRQKIKSLQWQSEAYLQYMHKNSPEQFEGLMNLKIELDRLKMSYDRTNDPNLKIQYKERGAQIVEDMRSIYDENKSGYEKYIGITGRGVREREEKRLEEGRTIEQDRVEASPIVQEMPVPASPVPEFEPQVVLSKDAKRNDRQAWMRRAGSRARKFFDKAVRSNGGIKDRNVEEVIRSGERIRSAWMDEMTYQISQYRDIMRGVMRSESGVRISKTEKASRSEDVRMVLEGRMKVEDLPYLTEKQRQGITAMRENIDSLSDQLIYTLEQQPTGSPEQAQSKADLIQKIRSNKGVYLNRSYEIFSDGGKRLSMLLKPRKDMPTEIRKAYDDAVKYIANNMDDADALAMSSEQRMLMAEREIRKYLMAMNGAKDSPNFGIMGAIDAPFLKARNNEIPKEFLNLLGEIKDPLHGYANTLAKLNSYLGNVRWQNELAIVLQESGIAKIGSGFEGTEGPGGLYVRLAPDSEQWRPLYDLYVPQDFYDSYQNLQPLKTIRIGEEFGLDGFVRSLIGLTAKVKVGKTVLAPTTTARNMVSGVFLGMGNGHFLQSPEALQRSFLQATGDRSMPQERRKLIELGVLSDGANSGELMQTLNDSMRGDINRIVKRGGGVMDFAQKLYAFGDDFYKVNGYYIERQSLIDAGVSIADAEAMAARRVRDGYPTYSKISKGAKAIRRFPLTGSFVSFPYEMYRTTRNQFEFIAEDMRAGRTDMARRRAMGLLAASTMAYGTSELSLNMLGLTDEDDEAIKLLGPEWQQLSQLFYLGKENGVPYFMDASYYLPHEVVAKPIRALFGGDPTSEGYIDNVMSAVDEVLSPYYGADVTFRGIEELLSNSDSNGNKIVNEIPGATPLENLLAEPEKALVHLTKTIAPGFTGNVIEIIRSQDTLEEDHPLYEAQQAFGRYFPKETRYREYTTEDALLALIGARMTYLPLDLAAENQISDKINYISNKQYEIFQPIQSGDPVTETSAGDMFSEYISLHESIVNDNKKIVGLSRMLGLETQEVYKILKSAGVPEGQIGLYLIDAPVIAMPISDERITNMWKKATWSSRITPEEKTEIATNMVNGAALYNKRVAMYNERLWGETMTAEEINLELSRVLEVNGITQQTSWMDDISSFVKQILQIKPDENQ